MKFSVLLLTLLLGTSIVYAQNTQQAHKSFSVFESERIPNKYFKIISKLNPQNKFWKKTSIEVYNKATNGLIQVLDEVYTMISNENEIQVEDYNFDGQYEFSLFEQYYSGTNSTRLYYLYNPKIDRFFLSKIYGTSLEFDPKEKRVYEHNQSCAGSSITEAIYKIRNNEMVLIEQHCYELSTERMESEYGLEYVEIDCN